VASWIRHRRLERSRTDLLDPTWRAFPSTPSRLGGASPPRPASTDGSGAPTAPHLATTVPVSSVPLGLPRRQHEQPAP
jgi:hypothetical protein